MKATQPHPGKRQIVSVPQKGQHYLPARFGWIELGVHAPGQTGFQQQVKLKLSETAIQLIVPDAGMENGQDFRGTYRAVMSQYPGIPVHTVYLHQDNI